MSKKLSLMIIVALVTAGSVECMGRLTTGLKQPSQSAMKQVLTKYKGLQYSGLQGTPGALGVQFKAQTVPLQQRYIFTSKPTEKLWDYYKSWFRAEVSKDLKAGAPKDLIDRARQKEISDFNHNFEYLRRKYYDTEQDPFAGKELDLIERSIRNIHNRYRVAKAMTKSLEDHLGRDNVNWIKEQTSFKEAMSQLQADAGSDAAQRIENVIYAHLGLSPSIDQFAGTLPLNEAIFAAADYTVYLDF